MNIFTFTGNLGKDCEVKFLPSGKPVCSFSVAVKSGYGDKEKTTWVSCAIFGKKAEGKLPQYLTKGAKVAISGELTLDEWQADGVTNKMLKVNVNTVDLIGGLAGTAEPQGSPSGHQGASGSPSQQAATPDNPQNFDSFDEDIPFS